IGVQGQFVKIPAPSSVYITGCTYHHMLSIDTPNHSLYWYIYDEQERYVIARNQKIPDEWISTIQIMLTQYQCHLIQKQCFLVFGRLTSEYLVDIYSRVEEERLNFILKEKKCLSKEKTKHNQNNITIEEDFENKNNENEEGDLHLPASFLDSKRWCSTHVANALVLACCLGKPSFFITMTTNPNWKEIHSQLQPGQNALEIALIVVRSFHSRFKKLKNLIHTHFEKIIYIIEVIKFQKRGFPYAHIVDYIKGRYLSASEAVWRIFHYPITISDPSVLTLPIHLLDTNILQYIHYQRILSSASLLDHYLLRSLESIFTQLKYTEYYENYILYSYNSDNINKNNFIEQEHPNILKKIVQKRIANKITKIVLIVPGAGELFYLRKVAHEMGLFANESESILTMKEAIDNFYTPAQLRFLFTQLILDGVPSLELWQQYKNNYLADHQGKLHNNHSLAIDITLQEIASMLGEHGQCMHNFGLPEPHSWTQEVTTELQCYSDYIKYEQLAEKFHSMMTSEQTIFYENVVKYILEKKNSTMQSINEFPIFLNGKAGQGKTFLINAICYKIQVARKIILICETTALSALLYEVKENDEIINDHPIATPDYLTQLTYPGIPNHEIHLKVGTVIITNLKQRLIEVEVLKHNNFTDQTETHLIPRINFYFQPDYCSWTVHRKQFPLCLAYSTTFNSCQGLTLNCAVIDLRTNVFAHGQLYTAISRVKNRTHALILLPNNNSETKALNVVYEELIQ
ncbi:15067_t:CDS:2, partial [Cetraspora pellucida]